jgi:NTP pyrophosphatase (non-canonical NTP hydrolase)
MDKITAFNDYQKQAVAMSISLTKLKEKYPDLPKELVTLIAVVYDGLGLGEAGEVQGKVKKIVRDNGGVITEEARQAIKDELGDTLWYIASMCENLGITLEDVATRNIEKLVDRNARGVRHGSGDYR